MRNMTQHFILNKESDFSQGMGASYEDGAACVERYYLSGLFDSGKKDMRWYRMDSVLDIPANTGMQITFYVSDEEKVEYEGQRYELCSLLKEARSLKEKKRICSTLAKKTVKYLPELLLSDLHGRYLFFLVESMPNKEFVPKLIQIRLYFQPNMWIDELPEIFRQEPDSFLERYLAIFQNIYEQMEEQIRRNSDHYSVYTQSYEFLLWLSSWYCMTQPQLWTKEQLQYLLKHSHRIYKRLGTREIMEEICELYLGEKPVIVEYYEAEEQNFKEELPLTKEQLAINPYVFTIVVRTVRLSGVQYDHFLKIVDSCKPVHMEANIIFLKQQDKQDDAITLL